MPDLVSIVALNYNNAQWVSETLDSIAEQCYQSIELIIVDDCSTDNSVSIIEQWLLNYKGIYTFIKHTTNTGICKACNDGMKAASGKYISIIATDDLMMPHKVSRQVEFMRTLPPNAAVVYSDAKMMREDGSELYGLLIQSSGVYFEWPPSGNIYDVLLDGNFVPPMNTLIKKEALERVGYCDEDLSYEDYDLYLRLAEQFEFYYLNEIVSVYRVRKKGLRATMRNWDIPNFAIFQKHVSHPKAQKKLDEIAARFYLSGNAEGLKILKQASYKSPLMKKILQIVAMKIPYFIGKRIIARVN